MSCHGGEILKSLVKPCDHWFPHLYINVHVWVTDHFSTLLLKKSKLDNKLFHVCIHLCHKVIFSLQAFFPTRSDEVFCMNMLKSVCSLNISGEWWTNDVKTLAQRPSYDQYSHMVIAGQIWFWNSSGATQIQVSTHAPWVIVWTSNIYNHVVLQQKWSYRLTEIFSSMFLIKNRSLKASVVQEDDEIADGSWTMRSCLQGQFIIQ